MLTPLSGPLKRTQTMMNPKPMSMMGMPSREEILREKFPMATDEDIMGGVQTLAQNGPQLPGGAPPGGQNISLGMGSPVSQMNPFRTKNMMGISTTMPGIPARRRGGPVEGEFDDDRARAAERQAEREANSGLSGFNRDQDRMVMENAMRSAVDPITGLQEIPSQAEISQQLRQIASKPDEFPGYGGARQAALLQQYYSAKQGNNPEALAAAASAIQQHKNELEVLRSQRGGGQPYQVNEAGQEAYQPNGGRPQLIPGGPQVTTFPQDGKVIPAGRTAQMMREGEVPAPRGDTQFETGSIYDTGNGRRQLFSKYGTGSSVTPQPAAPVPNDVPIVEDSTTEEAMFEDTTELTPPHPLGNEGYARTRDMMRKSLIPSAVSQEDIDSETEAVSTAQSPGFGVTPKGFESPQQYALDYERRKAALASMKDTLRGQAVEEEEGLQGTLPRMFPTQPLLTPLQKLNLEAQRGIAGAARLPGRTAMAIGRPIASGIDRIARYLNTPSYSQ